MFIFNMICHIRTVWIQFATTVTVLIGTLTMYKFDMRLHICTGQIWFTTKNAMLGYQEYAYFHCGTSYPHRMWFVYNKNHNLGRKADSVYYPYASSYSRYTD